MSSGLLLPRGYLFAGVSAGIKSKAGARDVAMIIAERPCTLAGVFTTNQIVAAPVVLSRGRCPRGDGRGVVINSGNANACTGRQGEADAAEMSSLAAAAAGQRLGQSVDESSFVVMSTGIIGRQLPMEKIRRGIPAAAEALGASENDFLAASDGIMTTDATRKVVSRASAGSGSHRIAAMAKGAGMIGPKMATMLSIVVTDKPLTPCDAQRALQYAADRSFNCVSVEGHTSTNDSLVLLAASASDAAESAQGLEEFNQSLTDACIELAKMIPDDGEGATHLIEVRISGAGSDRDADVIARSVATSNLVKTAIYGGDPNWGRIVSAAGYAGVPLRPDATSLSLNGHRLFEAGQPLPFDAAVVSRSIRENRRTELELTVGYGSGSATHWTSDLGTAYVEFNSEYST